MRALPHPKPVAAVQSPVNGDGCDQCRGTGFRGRVGVFETAVATEEAAAAVAEGKTEDELRSLIRSAGTSSLTADALLKVRDGLTSFEEAITMRWL